MNLEGLTGALAEFIRGEVAKQYKAVNEQVLAQISHYFPLRDLDAQIFTLPDAIRSLREKIIMKRQTLRTIRQVLTDREQELKEAEAGLLADIIAEILESGKPQFSNDKARSAELMRRKKVDPDYQGTLYALQDARSEAENLEDAITSLEAEVKTKEMEFQGALRLLENINQEMAIFAALSGAGGGGGCGCKGHSEPAHSNKQGINEEGSW